MCVVRVMIVLNNTWLICTAGGTDTVAIPQSDGTYHLHGYKWFTSAAASNMAFTLARVVDKNGLVTDVSYFIHLPPSCFV